MGWEGKKKEKLGSMPNKRGSRERNRTGKKHFERYLSMKRTKAEKLKGQTESKGKKTCRPGTEGRGNCSTWGGSKGRVGSLARKRGIFLGRSHFGSSKKTKRRAGLKKRAAARKLDKPKKKKEGKKTIGDQLGGRGKKERRRNRWAGRVEKKEVKCVQKNPAERKKNAPNTPTQKKKRSMFLSDCFSSEGKRKKTEKGKGEKGESGVGKGGYSNKRKYGVARLEKKTT